MGSPGQKSVQISFKVNEVLREKIEYERNLTGGTLAEFLNDAVKYYINYLENKRFNENDYREYIQNRNAQADENNTQR